MSKMSPWIDRKFEFDFDVDAYPSIIERIKNTPEKIEELIAGLNDEQLKQKPGDKWSIQEHVGHLIITEMLFDFRLNDFEAGAEVLKAADMSNQRTYNAHHNEKDICDILEELKIISLA